MTRRRQLRRTAAALTVAVAAMCSGAASISHAQHQQSQQEGPVVFGQKKQTDWLTLHETRGELETLYRYQNAEIDPSAGAKSTFTENRFEETLTLEGNGSIYHPNLIELNPLKGTFGLFQSDLSNNGSDDSSNGTLYEWDVAATILRKEDYVPTLYSRRTRQLVDRTFGPTLDTEITTTGAILDIRKKVLPTRIEVYHQDEDQSAPDNTSGDFHLSQDALVWHSEYRPSDRQVFTWDYTYNNVDQSTGDVHTKFDTNDATLSHSIDFGDKAKNNLTSTLHYFNQSGDINVDQFYWDELLRLRHTDNFETHYEYTFNSNDYSGVEQTVNRGVAGFQHRLYKSLVTSGEVGVADTTGDNENTLYFTDLNFDYHKVVPYGRLSATAGVGYTYQDFAAQNTPTQVIDQPHTFVDGQPIILTGNNVIADSIIITDTSGLIVYVNGVDYTVQVFPDNVQITRVIGGRIAAGQTVLIDFRLSAQPANTVDTFYYYASARYDIEQGPFRGLGMYIRYSNQNQNIDSNSPTAFIDNSFTDTVIGADYKFWLMKVGAEQEWHDSTIAPFDATRFYVRLDKPFGHDSNLAIQSNYDIINYKDGDNTVTDWITSIAFQHRFNKRLWGSVTLIWQQQHDDLNGDTNGLEEQAELQWSYRQTYIYGRLRNSQLNSDTQDSAFTFFELGLRREF